MRIIGGKLSGRQIKSPISRTTRPMLDRIREALFNIVEHHDWGKTLGKPLDNNTNVLDAFCGTGALAFEALSRGAAQATLFDKDRQALKIATENAEDLKLKDRCQIMAMDALHPPKASYKCRLVFLSPPYRKGLIAPALAALDKTGWIAPDALIIAETARREALELPENFMPSFSRYYADTALHFVISASIK